MRKLNVVKKGTTGFRQPIGIFCSSTSWSPPEEGMPRCHGVLRRVREMSLPPGEFVLYDSLEEHFYDVGAAHLNR